jgi:hypothetical protein
VRSRQSARWPFELSLPALLIAISAARLPLGAPDFMIGSFGGARYEPKPVAARA